MKSFKEHITDNTFKAYSYAKDIKDMPKKYLGKMSKFPLFQNLTPEFIYDYKKEIDEQIGEEIRNETH